MKLLRIVVATSVLSANVMPTAALGQGRGASAPTIAAPAAPPRPCRLPATPSSLPDQFSIERCQPLALQPQLYRPSAAERRLGRIWMLTMVGVVAIWGISQAAHHR
jgi:hypothetical protein